MCQPALLLSLSQYALARRHIVSHTCTCAGVYYEQGKLDMAIATYQEAISCEPQFPEAYNNLGNALREAGRTDEAVQCYTICIQLQFRHARFACLRRLAITLLLRKCSLICELALEAAGSRF